MEMVDSLEDDSMACGLLRMGFGSGTFRRTKWIGIWWIGSKVSRINAGKANTKQGAMNNLIRPFTFQVCCRFVSIAILYLILCK